MCVSTGGSLSFEMSLFVSALKPDVKELSVKVKVEFIDFGSEDTGYVTLG